MKRHNNKSDMTVCEQIEAIKDRICMEYCKWPDRFNEEDEGCELADSEHCKNCPLNEL